MQLTMFDRTPSYDALTTRLLERAKAIAKAKGTHEMHAGLRDLQSGEWRRIALEQGDTLSATLATVAWMLKDHVEYGKSLYPLPGGGWTTDIEEAVSARLAQLEAIKDKEVAA